MPEFNWEARSADGDLRSGIMQGNSRADVEKRLKGMRLIPIQIKKKSKEINLTLPWKDPVDVKTKVVFTRQLATMIDAGLPLVQCLEVLAQAEPHAFFRPVLYKVKQTVESGSTFADALKEHPKVFDELFVNLVAAGEAGGLLDTILNRLAVYMEKAMALKNRVKSAMRYPVIVVSASSLIIGVLLVKVIPSFAGIYGSLGDKKLPGLTQTVIDVSGTVVTQLPIVLTCLTIFIVGMSMLVRTTWGRYRVDWLLLNAPAVGPLVKKAAIARFTRTLGTLIASGVPILDGLNIVAKTSGNKVIEKGLLYARDRIAEGKNISQPLMEINLFPKMVVQMISVGENTGALDVMLTKIADFYEDEVDTAVEGLTSIIEPILMIGVGGSVAIVLIAMYLPIFGMADTVGGHGK